MKERLSLSELRDACSIPQIRKSDFLEIGSLFLYMPRSHKAKTMFIGSPESQVALCTGWNDPEFVVTKETVIAFSIIAPLRSLTGIDIMLWNLAANPKIRYVAFWTGSKYDETGRSKRPREVVKALWQNGVEDDGTVKGTAYKLNQSLIENGAIEIVRRVTENVALIDWHQEEKEKLGELAFSLPETTPYMERVRLPKLVIKEVETLPSEEIGISVRQKRAVDAWLHLLDRIMRYGKAARLETDQQTEIRELQFARVIVEEEKGEFYFPDWLAKIPELSLTIQDLENYYNRYFTPDSYLTEIYPGIYKFIRPKEDNYLYCELLYAFPRPPEVDLAVKFILEREGLDAVRQFLENNFPLRDETKKQIVSQIWSDSALSFDKKTEILLEIFRPPTNQVENIIRRIERMPDDADKTFVLWNPDVHGKQDRGRPCLIEMALLVREGRINARGGVFRSHDAPRGWLKNFYGIWRFLQMISQKTGYPVGQIEIDSESCHLYLSDQNWVKRVWLERVIEAPPSRRFDESLADPRGNFSIEIVGEEIVCLLLSPNEGKPLKEFKGAKADLIIAQLKHFNLVSQPDHGLYLGAELAKAEMALRMRVPYVQDRPLRLRDRF